MNEPKPSLMKDEQFWLRLPFMLLFFFAYQITELVIFGVMIIQLLYRMLMGERQMQLLRFGAQLSQYAYDCFRYLTFNTETKPFPFAEWPLGEAPERNPYMPAHESTTAQDQSVATSSSEAEKTTADQPTQDPLDHRADSEPGSESGSESGQAGSDQTGPRA